MKRQLVVETIAEFCHYLAKNNLGMDKFEVFELVEEIEEKLTEETTPAIVEMVDVALISLHDNPVVKAKVGKSNILYVDGLQINENCCMPALIEVLGRKLSVNLCNENGITHATLNVALNDIPMYDVVFEVKKLEGNEIAMEIARDTIENPKHDT